jgi:hypothetical protein
VGRTYDCKTNLFKGEMMDYQALKAEIDAHPEWVGFSDNAIADLLNAKTLTSVQSRFVTARSILAEIADGAAILDALESASAMVPAVKWAMVYLKGETGVDVGYPSTRAQLDALVAGGVLTEAQAEAVKGMALLPSSQAEFLGLGSISYNDVNVARAM